MEFRKVDPNLLERNQRRIESLIDTGKVKKRDRDIRPAGGTVLTREYRDVEYCVVATADGQYEFNGRRYPSLSMILEISVGELDPAGNAGKLWVWRSSGESPDG